MTVPPTETTTSASRYDEAQQAGGKLGPLWQKLRSELDDGSYEKLSSLRLLSEHLLREDGASYNVHSDPAGTSRAWPLDVAPLLLSQEQWRTIEQGIAQRAHLYDLVLQDIYGEQRLLRNGILPPELIFSHGAYARPWVGMGNVENRSLGIFAVDLARAADGDFYAIGDRTQIPSGSGYALENRVVMARLLPQMFRDAHVIRLAHYFSDLRAMLFRLGSARSENPRIVLLSAGSRNETYFEQQFLASYLGISLVEGQDLFVRKGSVWLRSLYGDERVDVILRRVDDDYCDPLEFRGESLLGVSGLTEAARRGNVKIVNPLGSGILENPAIRAFLPEIARYFGEPEPALKHPPLWWCGIDSQLKYVLANLDSLVLKCLDRSSDCRTVFPLQLNKREREQMRQRLLLEPRQWVAEQRLMLSTAPSAISLQLESHSVVLRGFAVRGERGDYSVMPGGLTRVATHPDDDLISNQSGSFSKDTWIVSDDEQSAQGLWLHPQHKLNEAAPERLVHGRSAENLFWLGRYAERVDMQLNLLRLLGRRLGNSGNMLDSPANVDQLMLLQVLTHFSRTYPGFTDAALLHDPHLRHAELYSLCTDITRVGSYAYNLYHLVLAGKKIQGVLSSELRRVLSQIEFELATLCNVPQQSFDLQSYLFTHHKDQLLALHCLTGQSMIRGLAWRFLDVGRRIERALAMLRLQGILVTGDHHDVDDPAALYLLLTAADNDVNFQQRYAAEVTPDRVLDLLLLEVNNPRSVAYQINKLHEHLESLPAHGADRTLRPEERQIIDASTRLRLSHSLELAQLNPETRCRDELRLLLDGTETLLREAATNIAAHYFNRTIEQQQSLSPVIR